MAASRPPPTDGRGKELISAEAANASKRLLTADYTRPLAGCRQLMGAATNSAPRPTAEHAGQGMLPADCTWTLAGCRQLMGAAKHH